MRTYILPARVAVISLLAIGLAACSAPIEARGPVSPAALAAPIPQLAPTAQFDTALVRATPDAERLAGGSAELAARARALRARAAALNGAIVDPATGDRLRAATASSP